MQAAGYSRLTDQERFYIKIRRADGVSIRDVARELGHAASTVSRELRRNALPDGGYCPVNAGRQARHRRWLGGLGRRSDERAHAFRLACSDAAERERHMTASASPTRAVIRVLPRMVWFSKRKLPSSRALMRSMALRRA